MFFSGTIQIVLDKGLLSGLLLYFHMHLCIYPVEYISFVWDLYNFEWLRMRIIWSIDAFIFEYDSC